MPISERAENFREEASNLAGRILNLEQQVDPEALVREVRKGLYIGDVLQESEQFTNEVEALRDLGLPFPVIRVAERNVPISIMNYFPYPDLPFRPPRRSLHPFYAEQLYAFVRNCERTSSGARFVAEIDEDMGHRGSPRFGFTFSRPNFVNSVSSW